MGHQLCKDFYLFLEDRKRADYNEEPMVAEEALVKAFLRESCPEARAGAESRSGLLMGEHTPEKGGSQHLDLSPPHTANTRAEGYPTSVPVPISPALCS